MLQHIEQLNFDSIVAADHSDAMLELCRSRYLAEKLNFTKQDIYNTSFNDASFSCVLSSRFLFHCSEQNKLLSELSRILKPGGLLVIDSISWSPRTWTRLFSGKLGGELYTNSDVSMRNLALINGFDILAVKEILMLPSFLYNFMPKAILKLVIALEHWWPKSWMTKRVWVFKKNE